MSSFEAAARMSEFAHVMERSVAIAVDEIVRVLWVWRKERVDEVAWVAHRNGDAEIVLTLSDGSEYRGRGSGKLDALAAIETNIFDPR